MEYGRCEAPLCAWDSKGPWIIIVPTYRGILARAWGVAHECGHLVLKHGPMPHRDPRQEAEADAWAAMALIPEAMVARYNNASVAAFLAALHRNYEPIPRETCKLRNLAVRIASRRMELIEETG